MPKLQKAKRVASSIVESAMRDLKETADLLELLPSVVRGVQFSRDTPLQKEDHAVQPEIPPENALLAYFNEHKAGPGIWKWQHYFDIYQRHFAQFVGREVHVVEVGIYSGGSLPMWKHYFGPGCRVYGVDIEEACKAYRDETTRVFIGDQADRAFWAKLRSEVPRVDILIDDGGHQPEQQIVTLEEMLPHLSPGGVYLCEDIHGTTNGFAAYLHGLATELHAIATALMPDGQPGAAFTASRLQSGISSIHLYPFAAVIEKRTRPVERLVAPKHGTQWQPFL